jgi:sulfate adenylyltransferase
MAGVISQGVALFFTGLPAAGKSTIARVVAVELAECYGRRVTLLDGDAVRKELSSELGYSREHRDLNIRRIGFVANEIVRHGGIAICAAIAPYRGARDDVRARIQRNGWFYEVYVSTPREVCERRDPKGLYSQARRGLIRGFTGIDDPYEAPTAPELTIDASESSVEAAARAIIKRLEQDGHLAAAPVGRRRLGARKAAKVKRALKVRVPGAPRAPRNPGPTCS